MAVIFVCDGCGEAFDRQALVTRSADAIAHNDQVGGSLLFCKPCEKVLQDWKKQEGSMIAEHRERLKLEEDKFVVTVAEERLKFIRSRRSLPGDVEQPRSNPPKQGSTSHRSRRRAPKVKQVA